MTGGGGNNRYLFLNAQQSTPENPDRITDFVSGKDQIDVSNLRATGPQSTYIDPDDYSPIEEVLYGAESIPRRDIAKKRMTFTSQFTGEARQAIVDYDYQRQQATLQIDLDGDRRADFLLKIDSKQPLEGPDIKQ